MLNGDKLQLREPLLGDQDDALKIHSQVKSEADRREKAREA